MLMENSFHGFAHIAQISSSAVFTGELCML